MRIIYIDIDCLRPDHLGCYGYHRDTSPTIDRLAAGGVRFENCYVPDAPCLPSRSALWSGRCGFHTGVVGHGGTAADPFVEGPTRGFRDLFGITSWMKALRDAGIKTVTVSPFGERHSAWHWYAGYSEIYNTGRGGLEIAPQIAGPALDWIQRNAQRDDWFLHVNFWDPHTLYRTPEEFGNPFADDPLPAWLTEEVRQRGWDGYGPHSPREPLGWGWGEGGGEQLLPDWARARTPPVIDSMDAVRRWIDGYDVAIRYVDDHIAQLLNALSDAGVLDETVVILSADHGENLGELNVWGDHQTADHITSRVPLIVHAPGLTDTARVDRGLLYHFDWAATLIELAGGKVPDNWDGRSFTEDFKAGREHAGRECLVVSQSAWSCMRSVRFGDHICLRTYHDGLKMLEPVMLFNVSEDPHEQHNLAASHPELVERAMGLLAQWQEDMLKTSRSNVDPLATVLREGGPFHTRGVLPKYMERLRETDRAHHAETLAQRHPDEC